jgi:hypothetical protein
VDQESATGFEPNTQILATALQRDDAFPLELGRDGDRLERAHEAGIVDVHALEPAADDVRFECEADRLDLG